MIATVARLAAAPNASGNWQTPPWRAIASQSLRHHMGPPPSHCPPTAFKIAYEAAAVHVMFRVADRYVRAVAQKHQDSVCGDSCVEFFFTPGTDLSAGYFNLEVNCGGTVLFHFHPGSGKDVLAIPANDCERIVKAHSMPRIVDPEIQEPVTWTVACAVPIALLREYCPVHELRPGATWRANFYKCADHTSHPHWLTWSPVDHPRPNFHLPRAFGWLEFAR